ncbi:hypothetical protein BGP_3445 [Beggiatoa sp. PS]|nr:hypothetical protein BGP_3445 [Beggiatoa sp. PS]
MSRNKILDWIFLISGQLSSLNFCFDDDKFHNKHLRFLIFHFKKGLFYDNSTTQTD